MDGLYVAIGADGKSNACSRGSKTSDASLLETNSICRTIWLLLNLDQSLYCCETIFEMRSSFLNYPLGKMDHSYSVGPSLSMSGKYLLKPNDDFSILKIRFNRNVDIDIVDLSISSTIRTITLRIPTMEYSDEKYQFPWSKKDDSFFGFRDDSLFKFYLDNNSRLLLVKSNLYDFDISPSERYAVVHANDSLFLYDLAANTNKYIHDVGKRFGMNRKFVRSISWLANESKFAFVEGWKIFTYDLEKDSLQSHKISEKGFALEWINSDSILCVTGDYPSDISTMQTDKHFKIIKYSLLADEYEIIHDRVGHEPFTVRPKLSPSKKLFLFSEKKLNGDYQVKLMSLDGKNKDIIADGFLPFYGFRNVK